MNNKAHDGFSSGFSNRGGLWVFAQSILMVVVGALSVVHRFQWQGEWGWQVGVALLFPGAYTGIVGTLALGNVRTAFPFPKSEATLIKHGIYRWIRHPLYTSLILLSFGWALTWASGTGLAVALLFAVFLNGKARREERYLREVFPEYVTYCKRVPRFIPRFLGKVRLLTYPLSAWFFVCGALIETEVGLLHAGQALTLEQALDEVELNNPDARISKRRINEAQAVVRQANSFFWPKLSFLSSYHRTDNPIGVFGAALNQRSFSPTLDFNDVPDVDNLLVQGVVSVPLYTGGRISSAREAAREDAVAASRSADAVRNRLAFNVTQVFFTISKTEAMIDAAQSAVQAFEQNVSIARTRMRAGTALKTVVLDVEVRLAEAQADLVDVSHANELARRALGNLLGRENEAPDIEDIQDQMRVPSMEPYQDRPELKAMAGRKAAARANVRRANSGNLPNVSAFLSADHNRGWEFNGDGNSYTAGLMIQWKLWDGFMTRGKIDEARARVAVVEEQERKLRLSIDFELHQSRLNLKAATERLKVAEKAVVLSEESVQLTRVRFEQGLTLATQLIDAETALTNSRVRVAQARGDRKISIAALRYSLGLPQLEHFKSKE